MRRKGRQRSGGRRGAKTVVGSCTYGELGRVPGAPFGVATIGSSVFVVASQFVNGGAGNSEGSLYAIGEDGGTTLLDQNSSPNLTAFGDQGAFLDLEHGTNSQPPPRASIERCERKRHGARLGRRQDPIR